VEVEPMSNVALNWMGERSRFFVCRDSAGNVVSSGYWDHSAGDDGDWQAHRAPRPTDLLLMSLASCAAYDVVNILARGRQTLKELQVDVDGQQAPTPPQAFTAIHLHFILGGTRLNPAKAARAVHLSVDKYCPVAATLRGVCRISHSHEIREWSAS
jgi:putative redox protein